MDNDLDMEPRTIYDILKHYEMALHSQAIQIELLKEDMAFLKAEHKIRRETLIVQLELIKKLEARVDDLEKDGRSKTSPSGQQYDNYYGDYSSWTRERGMACYRKPNREKE